MRKFIYGFSVCFAITSFSLVAYLGLLLYVAKPGYYVSKEPVKLSVKQKSDVVVALIKLTDLANFFGQEKYSALFLGSAGILAADAGISAIESKYFISKAVAIAKIYGDQTGDFNPFMESRFTFALFLKDNNEIDEAKKVVSETIAFANSKDPQNYWIENFERLNRKL